ncbi:hypothetical protein AB0K74_18225 [Streptomyces sp. NPDC056159]|uniref:hypothetical protein n=1 Tax=Streptomyces sp. NPDC056159 TaxID=3155537 RepID=UPI003437855B
METKYLARLQFEADGPAVEGEWTLPSTARDRYTEWVGLYSKDPNVVVRLIQETDGRKRMLRTWTTQGETVA